VPEIVLFFKSNADTMIATRALKEGGVAARIIPRPANAATTSNLCLSIDEGVEANAKTALSGTGVALAGIVK
jgi:hypothetical protein